MGQLRTANKRRNRAILTAQARGKADGGELPTPTMPAAEAVQS